MKHELLAELWRRYGSESYPAEWDGKNYGGGKLSQRYWEYFITLSLIDFRYDTAIVDIGGGCPTTGKSFLSDILRTRCQSVLIDENAAANDPHAVREMLSFTSMKKALEICPKVTDVICVSVLEHMPAEQQREFCRIVNAYDFRSVIFTLEFHPKNQYFNYQLTTETLSSCMSEFTNYYPSRIEASPVLCVNSFKQDYSAWYPLAIKFVNRKMASALRNCPY